MPPALRPQLNRFVVGAGLLAALPQVAVAGRVRTDIGQAVARGWIGAVAAATGVRFQVRGRLHLPRDRRCVLVANHSSPLDIAALLAVTPGVRFVAGADLFGNALLAPAMRAVGTVAVDRRRPGRSPLAGVGADSTRPLAVFAEGGIAPPGCRLRFRTGAFALAIELGALVVPVAIHHAADRLAPGARLAVRPGPVVVEFLPAVDTAGLTGRDRRPLRDRVEHAVLAALGPADGGRGPGAGAAARTATP